MDRHQEAELLSQLRGDAERIASAFGLRYRAIVAEHPRVKSRYGACYSDGLISIRLRHATTRAPLKYSSLVDTLCHELAHLRHFDHSPQFKAFFLRLLGWARQQGIYCPGPGGEVPELGPFVPSARALAVALQPSRRNGVPVFVRPPEPEDGQGELLPWERHLAGRGPASPKPRPRPGRRPAPTPLVTAQDAQPVPPPPAPASTSEPAPPARQPAAASQRQLTLF